MTTFTPTTSFWVSISVYADKYRKEQKIGESLRWDNMTMEVRTKWQWYFDYRAALLKVQHPRCHVHMTWGSEEAKEITRLHLLKKRVANKQGQLTKARNALANIQKEYESDFFMSQAMTIEEYFPAYSKVVNKIAIKKRELDEMQRELNQLLNPNT